jgi:hypothetical protein
VTNLGDFKARRPILRDVDYFNTAVILSVTVHLAIALVWALNRQYGFLHPDLFKFLEAVDPTRLLVQERKKEEKVIDSRLLKIIQFKLAEVDPASSTPPPDMAEFYGAANSVAANEQPTSQDTGRAKIDGTQTRMVRTEDTARPQEAVPPASESAPTEPAPTVKPQPPAPKEEPIPAPPPKAPEPKTPPKPEVVRVAKAILPKVAPPEPTPAPPEPTPAPTPEPKPKPELKPDPPRPPEPVPLVPTPQLPPRPRTLQEARARQQSSLKLVGERMRQDGGVSNQGGPRLNVMGTSFGAYDTKLINLIQDTWFNHLDRRVPPPGKVVVRFRLLADGRVVNVEIAESNVDDFFTTICQMAVNGPKFDPWPNDMRRQLQDDFRDHTITFYYN